MATASLDHTPTHIKLFEEAGQSWVALFRGSNESSDWLQNVAADTVLREGWDSLPRECLLEVGELRERGLWLDGAPSSARAINTRAWRLRLITLHQQLGEQAAANGHARLLADHCLQVAQQLRLLQEAPLDHQAIGWQLRASEGLVSLWQQQPSSALAVELMELFDELSKQSTWPADQAYGAEQAERNARFWWGQALQQAAQESDQLEKTGDLNGAAQAAQTVLQLAAHSLAVRNIAAN